MSRVSPPPSDTEGRPAELVDLLVQQFPQAGYACPDGERYDEFAAVVKRFLSGVGAQVDDRLLTDPAKGQCPLCRAATRPVRREWREPRRWWVRWRRPVVREVWECVCGWPIPSAATRAGEVS